jgi:hypothetical protein
VKPYERDAIIWLACRHDMRHIKTDLLSTVSRAAMHYGMGGEIHPLIMDTMRMRGMNFKGHTGGD